MKKAFRLRIADCGLRIHQMCRERSPHLQILNSRFSILNSPARRRIQLALLGLIALVASLTVTPIKGQELFQEENDLAATDVDRIYVKGINYLLRTQTADGTWPDKPYGAEPAVVALSIISMMAHGDEPNFGLYSGAIKKGLEYILKQQNKDTGYIGRSMYNHGFATLALAEAYGAVDDPRLGPALQLAVRLILNSQEKNSLGAWRYSPESSDADTTVSGAQIVALFAARNAGIAVKEEAIQRALKFLEKCQTPDGGIGYTSNSGPNSTRTAIACLAFSLAKEKTNPIYLNAFKYLQRAPGDLNYHEYNLYYVSQAFFHAGPQHWRDWNLKNIKSLGATQTPEGSWEGSQFGSTFATAGSLLSLALNYRYLPIYER
jgi:squalene cyclase